MSDLKDLISIMQQQLEQQRKEHKAEMELQRMQLELQQNKMEQQQKEHKVEIALQREQLGAVLGAVLQQRDAELKQRDQQHKDELDTLLSLAAKKLTEGMSTPSFAPFDSTTELTGPDSLHLLLPTPSLMIERHRYF